MNFRRHFAIPFFLPIAAFATLIAAGGAVLALPEIASRPVSLTDAFFVATSAVCVTGLAPFDVFEVYDSFGQSIVLALMQLGGIGIIFYATLMTYIAGKKISLADRITVEQGIYYNPHLNLAFFARRVFFITLSIELCGTILIFAFYNEKISLFNSVFLSVSAFCNAGFAPWGDSLEMFRGAWGLNCIIMALIISGGIGFFVLDEIMRAAHCLLHGRLRRGHFSFYSRIVLQTTFWLIMLGAGAIFLTDMINPDLRECSIGERILSAFFEAVTSRTAGFATVNQASYGTATLFLVIFLMLIGGSPASCAGGIKTTTFRVLVAQLVSFVKGRDQVIVGNRAIEPSVVARTMLLFSCAMLFVFTASFLLLLFEQGGTPHQSAPPFFDIFFEVASALSTVGLSINLTGELSDPSKWTLCLLMFTGKLGPIWLISAIQQLQTPLAYRYPADILPIG